MIPYRKIFFSLALSSLSALAAAQPVEGDRWEQVKSRKEGVVTVHWYESEPFIFRSTAGLKGIEYDLMQEFGQFLKKKYDVDLQVVWKEAKSFGDSYARIRDDQQNGTFAVSAFSVTPERQKDVGFAPPYMSDISVLITSKGIPIVQTREEFNEVFSKLTAVTIHETTYEDDIKRLKLEGNLPFKTQYIPSSENILKQIESRDSSFGFIDLPVYMMMFADNPSVNVKRQNMFPVKRTGYAIIYPQNSDWSVPMGEFFQQPGFDKVLEEIIGRYIDIELYHFIESLAIQSNDLVVLLTKEKEIQYQDLLGKADQIVRESRMRNFLIALVGLTLMSMGVITVLYTKRSQQKRKIEMQQNSIALKNEQLEKRNNHLVILDEEKNNLIKILAHDLRTPINHVQGLAQVFLLSNESLADDQKMIIERINQAAMRLNTMISNILDIDSIENSRVKILMDEVVVAPLLSQVVKSFEKEAARKDIDLSFIAAKTDLRMRGDTLFLIQIFENLLTNAIKFSAKGKQVEVVLQEHPGMLRVSIKDSGPGLTAEDQQLLFRKFQRLSAKPTDGEHSTGLGLFIVKKYVDLMKGRVWSESEFGSGATFIVEFPCYDASV
jgi:signal transduction histidine kinase